MRYAPTFLGSDYPRDMRAELVLTYKGSGCGNFLEMLEAYMPIPVGRGGEGLLACNLAVVCLETRQ